MLKKNLTTLFAFALVALAVPAFAGDVLGDYQDSYAEDSESNLRISIHDGSASEYSWITYDEAAAASGGAGSVAPIREVDCRDTDDVTVAYFKISD